MNSDLIFPMVGVITTIGIEAIAKIGGQRLGKLPEGRKPIEWRDLLKVGPNSTWKGEANDWKKSAEEMASCMEDLEKENRALRDVLRLYAGEPFHYPNIGTVNFEPIDDKGAAARTVLKDVGEPDYE